MHFLTKGPNFVDVLKAYLNKNKAEVLAGGENLNMV